MSAWQMPSRHLPSQSNYHAYKLHTIGQIPTWQLYVTPDSRWQMSYGHSKCPLNIFLPESYHPNICHPICILKSYEKYIFIYFWIKKLHSLQKIIVNKLFLWLQNIFFNQTDARIVLNQSENGKYNLISVWFNKIYLCVTGILPRLLSQIGPSHSQSKFMVGNLNSPFIVFSV